MKIKILTKDRQIREHNINADILKVGRDLHNEIAIDDEKVSRNHLIIIREGNSLKIKDTGSRNGTYINGEKIQPEIFFLLKESDSIRVGDTELIIECAQLENINARKNNIIIPLSIGLASFMVLLLFFAFYFSNRDQYLKPNEAVVAEEASETSEILNEPIHDEIEEPENSSKIENDKTEDLIANESEDSGVINEYDLEIESILRSVVDIISIYSDGTEGYGTGTVYSSDGYILTNNHVVENASKIVVLDNNHEYQATVSQTFSKIDIAVIKVNGSLYKPRYGNSTDLKIGQEVIAIGSPFGLSHTVTKGIISALRDVKFNEYNFNIDIRKAIQHDASLNPGNSGGPLLNSGGQIIGVNAFIVSDPFSESFTSTGLSFAIPIDQIFSNLESN